MRKSKLLLGLVSLVVNSTWLIETAHADRRSGLAGNLLIEDPDDLFAFPQLTLQHRNLIRLDYGGNAASGNGVLTLGNESEAVGLSLHRGDLLSPDVVGYNTELAWLGGVEGQAPLSSTSYGTFAGPALDIGGDTAAQNAAQAVLPSTVVDLSYARRLAGGNPFGVRLGFGRGVRARKDADDDVQKGAQTFIAGQIGYSDRDGDGLRWDSSVNAVIGFGRSTDAAGQDVNSGWNLRVAGLGRGYYPINRLVDIGFLANVSIANEKTESDVANDTSRNFDFGVRGGVGPSLHLERAKIAAYGGLRLGAGKFKASGAPDDNESRLRLAAPMVNMAAEVQVLDWLYVRTGAEYAWELRRDGAPNEKERAADGLFQWSVGIGMQKGTFYFDGVVTNGFVTGGPNFIGGNANGFLAMASMTYKFGDVFGNAPRELRDERDLRDGPRPLVIDRPAERDLDRRSDASFGTGPATTAPAPVTEPVRPSAPDQELAPPTLEGNGNVVRDKNRVGGSANGGVRIGN